MIELGTRMELFVDSFLIEELNGVRQVLHQPVYAGKALKFDKPWEGKACGYPTVMKDGSMYRLYYRGWPVVGDKESGSVCCALSGDGKVFTKPKLGLYEMFGTWENNIILRGDGSPSFSPFIDKKPGIPEEEKYKALGVGRIEGLDDVLYAFVSADGVHWKKIQEEPVMTKGAFDSHNVPFWSEHEGCYAAYYRTWLNTEDPSVMKGIRTISRSTSEDFIHWSDPEPMDFGDTPPENLYTNSTFPYFRAPHIYLSFPKRFIPGRRTLSEKEIEALQLVPKYAGDISEGVFMTSRGGNTYDRTFMEAFLRPGPDRGNWISRSNMSAWGIVPTGLRELSLYYQHRYMQPAHYLARYTIRTDGFVSIQAPYQKGEFLTKPFTFSGERLLLNYETSGSGSINVELRTEKNQPIPGFTFENSDAAYGDEIERAVTWRGKAALKAVKNQAVRLCFRMKDADLYSIVFQ